ncbi:MAG: sugar phosphate isomerase/epimerase [Verrucomicrobia bacterium]|nr:sugar phosphate isomerase/epimerase [Verrucomicrobiota bacterium]MCF7707362.1 sugar phosphate isomerase/epimerase [Verrucomicrobiota bacterium]
MNRSDIKKRLAVCSWSLQPENPEQLAQQLQQLEIPRVQLALDPLRECPDSWRNIESALKDNGIQMVSGMFAPVGEDYSSLDAIRRTGGLTPDTTWEQNLVNIKEAAAIATRLGLSLVTFHAGFLPHDTNDPVFGKMIERLRLVADVFAEHDITLGLETGQESADTLIEFLETLDKSNVGVNFDPANMILYDKGDPIEALKLLGAKIHQCHIKDAIMTRVPDTLGEEVAVGTGEVDWRGFLDTLEELDFNGYLCIEREAGDSRLQDIGAACNHILSV